MAYRRQTTPGSFFLAVTWTFIVMTLVIAGLFVGYFSHAVFINILGIQVAFFGIGVFTKLIVDITRAGLNNVFMERRRRRAIENLGKGKWKNRRVGSQKVGRRESPLSLWYGFERDKNTTYPIEKFLYVSDGNVVSNPRAMTLDPNDKVSVKMVEAFREATHTPIKVDNIAVKAVKTTFGWIGRFLGFLLWLITFQWLIDRPTRVAPEQRIYNPIPGPLPFAFEAPKNDDSYQADIFLRSFGGPNGENLDQCEVIWVDFVLSEGYTNLVEARKLLKLRNRLRASTAKYIMILQPNRGKREVMYTAASVLIDLGMEWLFFTDSDTIVEENAIEELVYCTYTTRGERPVGAVTGDVRIFNVENWLSFMSSLRYWFAFNLERASQSFGGYVTCVSGPLGLYRAEALKQILWPWLNQRFLGRATTFGDDRSLTNFILRLGYAVNFTRRARCWTDTPVSLRIWIRQQTRWNKSYYREFLINIMSLWRFGPYLTFELFFQVIFPVFLALSLGNLISAAIATGQWKYAAIWGASIILGGSIRSFYAIIMEWNSPPDPQGRGKWKYIFFFFYGFMYIAFLMFARLYALATLPITDWGTPDRATKRYRTA